jgi:hypothetical protein
MKQKMILQLAMLIPMLSFAGQTTLNLGYEILDFENSKKKDEGKRYGVSIKHNHNNDIYQLRVEKTQTQTYQPPLTDDLNVNKYVFKYTHPYDEKQAVSASFLTIDDNLMKETDGGNIYGLGYRYGLFGITQYFSDYDHFDVYQTDLKYTFKHAWGAIKADATIISKYQHLTDRKSNPFSRNAKSDYFSPGVKMHLHYNRYHIGAGAFFGKRIFAVMDDGMRIQHHAMEFDKTFMIGIGKHFENIDLHLKYIYQEANEIPINNPDVKVDNIIFQLGYHF